MLFSLLSRWRVSYRPTKFTAFLPWLCPPTRRVLTCGPRLCFISAFPWRPCGSRGACPARLGLKPSSLPSPLRPCPRPPSCPSASRRQDAAAASRAPRRASNHGRRRCAPSEHCACAAPPTMAPLHVCAARGRAAGRTSAPVEPPAFLSCGATAARARPPLPADLASPSPPAAFGAFHRAPQRLRQRTRWVRNNPCLFPRPR